MKTAFCFDLDGTITSQEILPILAKEVDLYDEISTLTKVTMDGLIPFEKSFKLRVRLLSDIPISRVQTVIDGIELQKDIINFIKNNKDDCFIVTGNLDIWIEKAVKKIGCKVYSSIAEYDGEKLKGIKKILNKSDAVIDLKKKYDRVIAIGDGMNDALMFEAADISIACGSVHDPVETLIELADFVTYNQKGLCNILNTL